MFSGLPAWAATLGPVSSYQDLLGLLSSAEAGDAILVEGFLEGDGTPLVSAVPVRIQSGSTRASISSLNLRDASVTLTDVDLSDSLTIDGTSNVQLTGSTNVSGRAGSSGIQFSGSGTLIIDRSCSILGGDGSDGITIAHHGGECYISIDGAVTGGAGSVGGSGVTISPLGNSAAVMISGTIRGGDGDHHGGHALNLYDLSGNAYVTVAGRIEGGSGSVGGDGIQLVATDDNAIIGISGRVKGGSGSAYGGDALILMNAGGASSVSLSGVLSGGDAVSDGAQPGTSLQLVGDSASRAHVVDCILEDGKRNFTAPEPTPVMPAVTPLPEISAPIEEAETPVPSVDSDQIATPDEATPAEPHEQAEI